MIYATMLAPYYRTASSVVNHKCWSYSLGLQTSYVMSFSDVYVMVLFFVNSPGDRGSIPARVISKTRKWYLISHCSILSVIRYVSRVKWSNPGKGVMLFSTHRYSCYWKGSLRVTFDYGRQLYCVLGMTLNSLFCNDFSATINLEVL